MFPSIVPFQFKAPLKKEPSKDLKPLSDLSEHLIPDISRIVLEYCQVHSISFNNENVKDVHYYIFNQLVYTYKICSGNGFIPLYDHLDTEEKKDDIRYMESKRIYYSQINRDVFTVTYKSRNDSIYLSNNSKDLRIYNEPERILCLVKYKKSQNKIPLKRYKWINKSDSSTSKKIKLTIKYNHCWNGAKIKVKIEIIEGKNKSVHYEEYSMSSQGDIMSYLSFNTWRKDRNSFDDYNSLHARYDYESRVKSDGSSLGFFRTGRRYSVS